MKPKNKAPAPGEDRASGARSLGHLFVLDLTEGAAQAAGKLMAGLGADVVKIEPLGGDPGRSRPPYIGEAEGQGSSAYFDHYNTGKRSVTLDLGNPGDLGSRKERGRLLSLASRADVVIESFEPGYLDGIGLGYGRLRRVNPSLVMTSVTTFGQTGPYRQYLGSELVAQAMGGLMYVQGDDEQAPCVAPCDQAFQLAGFHALYGTLAALHSRNFTGLGEHVDVSAHESTANLMFTLARYAGTGTIVRRTGVKSAFAPNNYYRCSDGYACLGVFTDGHWAALTEWIDDDSLRGPEYATRDLRMKKAVHIDRVVADFMRPFTVQDFVVEGQKRHLCVSPLNTIADVAADPQPASRGFFAEVEHSEMGRQQYAGSPFRLSETPVITLRPPLRGEHQDDVPLDEPRQKYGDRASDGPPGKTLPLAGVRIADFTRVWAGPMCTRFLGDLGAEVIKIESGRFLDAGRDGGNAAFMFPELHRSKLGVTLNFQDPRGRNLAEELVSVSDIVIDNFAAGVLERRGLGYEALREIRPDVIVANMPGYGTSGPYSNYISYGQNLMAYSGFSHLWGHPGSGYETHSKLHYPDFVGAASGTVAVLAALEHRTQTGRGQYVEVDQSEALLSTMGVALLDYFANGNQWGPSGNRNPGAAPHGCYPCLGEDQWCVIECWNEEQWLSLCEAIEMPELADDSRFADLDARLRNQDALDALIGEWTATMTPLQVTRLLQRQRVPAGAVQSGEQLYHDRQLRARGFIFDEGDWERWGYTASPVHLSADRITPERGVPGLGEHNSYVYTGLLGTPGDDVARLVSEGVVA